MLDLLFNKEKRAAKKRIKEIQGFMLELAHLVHNAKTSSKEDRYMNNLKSYEDELQDIAEAYGIPLKSPWTLEHFLDIAAKEAA